MTIRRPPAGSTDAQLDRWLAFVLRTGVSLSAAVVLCGSAIYLTRHGHSLAEYHVFHGEPEELRSVRGIVSSARTLSGRGVIQLGLLMLIATPIARVVCSAFGFARQRNWLYVALTAVVLGLLGYSLTSG